eukprot:51102_1
MRSVVGWKLCHHIKSAKADQLAALEHILYQNGTAFDFQHDACQYFADIHDFDIFHCGLIDEYPVAAHYNMSSVFNHLRQSSVNTDRQYWSIDRAFQSKHNISALSSLDIVDHHQKNDNASVCGAQWKCFQSLPTKYKAFEDSIDHSLPYLVRQDTAQQLIIYRDGANVEANRGKVQAILDGYKPDTIVAAIAPHKPYFHHVLPLTEDDWTSSMKQYQESDATTVSYSMDTVLKYAVEKNVDIVLSDVIDAMKRQLELFSNYFDEFQYQLLDELQDIDLRRFIKHLHNICHYTVRNAPQKDARLSREFACYILRKSFEPHQHVAASYRNEFISFGINYCFDMLKEKGKGKKILAVLGDAHYDGVIQRLVGNNDILNVVNYLDDKKVILHIDRDSYTNWSNYQCNARDAVYLKQLLCELTKDNDETRCDALFMSLYKHIFDDVQ